MNAVIQLKTSHETLEDLCSEFQAIKHEENRLKKTREDLENKIVALVGTREEGSKTTELNDGRKLTITGKISYSADMDKLQKVCLSLPENLRPLKIKTELDQTGCKYLRANEPSIWKQIADAITIKPAKTAVEVK